MEVQQLDKMIFSCLSIAITCTKIYMVTCMYECVGSYASRGTFSPFSFRTKIIETKVLPVSKLKISECSSVWKSSSDE